MATPTLIQHISTMVPPIDEPGQDFRIPLPHACGAGNCLILGVTYEARMTLSLVDDGGNTWPAASTSLVDASNTTRTAIYVLPNVAVGTRVVTLHSKLAGVDTTMRYVQAMLSEFYNVATSAAVDATTSNGSSTEPNVSAGSFTPTNAAGNDLIWNYMVQPQAVWLNGFGSQLTGVTPGSGFTLLTADWQFGLACQYQVQATSTAVNPSATLSGDTQEMIALAVALKSASAGTAPSGIRIVHLQHTRNAHNQNPWKTGFPATGNLLCVALPGGGVGDAAITVTDNKSNSYTNKDGTTADQCRFAYIANATTGLDLALTLTFGSPTNRSGILYDISGAATAAFDKIADMTQSGVTNGSTTQHAPDLVPAQAGIVLAQCAYGTGPPSTSTGTGHNFVSCFYTGMGDGSEGMDSGDGHQIYVNPDTTSVNFTWTLTNNGTVSNISAEAIAFKATAGATTVTPGLGSDVWTGRSVVMGFGVLMPYSP